MGRVTRWLASHALMAHLLVTVITVGMVFGLAYARDRAHEAGQTSHNACVQQWADATAERAAVVAKARNAIDTADAELWRSVGLAFDAPTPESRAHLQARVFARIQVADQLETSLRANPVPPPPKLVCG